MFCVVGVSPFYIDGGERGGGGGCCDAGVLVFGYGGGVWGMVFRGACDGDFSCVFFPLRC